MAPSTPTCPLADDRGADPADPGDQLAELVRQHHAPLLARALRLTGGDHAWAEDVVQESFIRAWRRLDLMTEEHGSVPSWLIRVAHNLAVDGHRSRRARPVDADEAEATLEPAADAADEVLAVMQVEEALAHLGPQHRAVLEEVYLKDHSVAETARRLDIPPGTVKSRSFYALRQLRALMCPQEVSGLTGTASA